MKHTPGPWNIFSDDDGNRYVIGGDDILVADCYADYPDINLGLPSKKEFEANAQLIAAAPELLEQLKFAYELLCDCYTKSGINNDPKFKIMRAAIAKAKGE